MTAEKSPDNGDESFFHEHAKELAVGSALGLLGLVYAVAHRRMDRGKINETGPGEPPSSSDTTDNS